MISPLEGEMSPKATEGVAAREAPTFIHRRRKSPVGPTPSALPGISASRGEIMRRHAWRNPIRFMLPSVRANRASFNTGGPPAPSQNGSRYGGQGSFGDGGRQRDGSGGGQAPGGRRLQSRRAVL